MIKGYEKRGKVVSLPWILCLSFETLSYKLTNYQPLLTVPYA